jgi:hypothetical protein
MELNEWDMPSCKQVSYIKGNLLVFIIIHPRPFTGQHIHFNPHFIVKHTLPELNIDFVLFDHAGVAFERVILDEVALKVFVEFA